ncbi:hypothetical protein [Blattabacterium cuenoti]|uniref:hypothetical protein n=1 Tax=Blattabacterium cuenoti TaxID=1653831 RepID=UPI00163CA46C|nr:hypothetical protein [Blattabacterium cuenoti]
MNKFCKKNNITKIKFKKIFIYGKRLYKKPILAIFYIEKIFSHNEHFTVNLIGVLVKKKELKNLYIETKLED